MEPAHVCVSPKSSAKCTFTASAKADCVQVLHSLDSSSRCVCQYDLRTVLLTVQAANLCDNTCGLLEAVNKTVQTRWL